MSEFESRPSRRRFLQVLATATAATALLPLATQAQDLPPLSTTDPTANALAYTEDTASVDAARFPQHKASDNCLGCSFYQGKGARGACSLFPGKSVAGQGWCSAYAPRA